MQAIDNIVEKNKLLLMHLDNYDHYTYVHSQNVASYSVLLGQRFDLSDKELNDLGTGAILHDIGKIFTDKQILLKKDKLSENEFIKISKHAEMGYIFLKNNYLLPDPIFDVVLQHHERFNGSGYPNNLSNSKISLYSKIVSVCDVYDALVSERPYKKSTSSSEAIGSIKNNSGTLFDPFIVENFTSLIDEL